MNKKFLSTILFGALMVASTGTFVSCKDYDDDIKGLQEQIDKLATKDDLKAQIATLQAGLTSAAKDASDAITKATAAETAAKAAGDAAAAAKAAADKAVAEAKAEAIKAVQAEIEALKEEVNASTESALAEMRKEVAEATKKVEDIIGKIADMVTSVELLVSDHANTSSDLAPWLDFSTVIEQENLFSKDISQAITFTKGKQVQVGDKFLVRVSPTNAILTSDMISLVNSKGENLNDYLTVKSVGKFNDLLVCGSRAATSATGLWEIEVSLTNYDKTEFDAIAEKDGNSILFAVQVNNTLSTAATRFVTSNYDIHLNWDEYTPAATLNYFVDSKNVEGIRNRYATAEDGTNAGYAELVWNSNVPAVEAIKTGSKQNVTSGDNRDRNQGKALYPVVQGEPITISLTESSADAEVKAPANIRALYVTLDYQANAVESAPSEWNAWNSYSYSGLNTVVQGTSTEIIINGVSAINDVIGFRVYAVNFDGTLVDPDGKAFYVSVGKKAENTVYNTTWSWKANGSNEISKAAVETGVFEKSWVKDIAGTPAFIANDTVAYATQTPVDAISGIQYYDVNKNAIALSEATCENIKYVSITLTNASTPYWYDDDKTYSATLAYKNARGNVLKTITVTMTKVLPSFPSTFQAKVNQLNAEGTLNAFMAPVGAAKDGVKELNQSFNGLDNDANFIFGFANAQKVGNDLEDMEVSSASVTGVTGKTTTYTFTVANELINNETLHAATVSYNFGQISSKTGVENNLPKNYVVSGGEFKNIIFSCLAKINTYAWATAPEFTYAQTDAKTLFENIKSTNTRDGKYTTTLDKLITAAKDNMISDLSTAEYELWSQVAKDGAIKEGSMNEYFKPTYNASVTVGTGATAKTGEGIVFEANSQAQNPEATVYSTLIIKAKDYFGHDAIIEIKNVLVKKR